VDEPRVRAVARGLRERTAASDELAGALVELSAVLVDEEPLPDVLRRVAELAVAVVPGCDGAGVTLVDGERATTAAHTDDLVVAVDQQQYDAGDGPCLTAVRTRSLQSVDLDEAHQRWPDFAARARELGIRSFLAAPLVAGDRGVGSLNLYSRSPQGFEAVDDVLVGMFCGQASVALANARLYARAVRLNEQLGEALDSRAVIERAKGVLLATQGLDEDAAFEQLRAWSQARNTKLRDVAAEVVDRARGIRGATA
jgi:GAF domain-containing protein